MKKFTTTVIACNSIKNELKQLASKDDAVNLRFLPLHLHRYPMKLRALIQYVIDKAAPESHNIVLGFGLCSNATAELKAPETGLYIPKIHDCISMYLGGNKAYRQTFNKYPGTYFLTKSWIDNRKDPLGLIQHEYKKRVGEEMAREVMETEIKHYKNIAYINTISHQAETYRKRTKQNAHYFKKQYIELQGTNNLFRKIIYGPRYSEEFVIVPPKQTSHQNHFLK